MHKIYTSGGDPRNVQVEIIMSMSDLGSDWRDGRRPQTWYEDLAGYDDIESMLIFFCFFSHFVHSTLKRYTRTRIQRQLALPGL